MLLLDSNAVYWWAAQPEGLSATAAEAIRTESQLAVSAITWFELAWMVENRRVLIDVPLTNWLETIAEDVTTLAITPSIATTAVRLPASFPGDPMDRVIYATALEHGLQLVTSDRSLRNHSYSRQVTIW